MKVNQQFWKTSGCSEAEILKMNAEVLGLRHRKNKQIVFSQQQIINKNIEAISKVKLKPKHHEKPNIKENIVEKLEYLPFRESNSNYQYQKINYQHLMNMYEHAKSMGGIIQILSVGKLSQYCEAMKQKWSQLKSLTKQQILQFYLLHLLQYQFLCNGSLLKLKEGVDIRKSLAQAKFYTCTFQQLCNNQFSRKILEEEIVVIHNADQLFDLKDINLQNIVKNYGNQKLQLRIQHPMDFGFNPIRMTNTQDQMTIKQYIQYQANYHNEQYVSKKFSDKLKGGKIYFGVNFEPEGGSILQILKKKLKQTHFSWCQSNDILGYLNNDIPGCSSPQFYLKVKGCWTGGHQQNINMCAININHGPDQSEWYSIYYDNVQELRSALNDKFKQDLYIKQGLWYQRLNWFIQNGFSIKRILQKKGDMVVSGPGTLHWVRAYGIALQSAWNIFSLSKFSISTAVHRHFQNQKIRLIKSNIIPLKILFLKVLDHSYQQHFVSIIADIRHIVQKWLGQEEFIILNKFRNATKQLKKLDQLHAFCEYCKQEIFLYYANAWDKQGITCLKCLNAREEGTNITSVRLFQRFQLQVIDQIILFSHIKKGNIVSPKICQGKHIGQINCPFLQVNKNNIKTKKEEQQQQTLHQKIHRYILNLQKLKKQEEQQKLKIKKEEQIKKLQSPVKFNQYDGAQQKKIKKEYNEYNNQFNNNQNSYSNQQYNHASSKSHVDQFKNKVDDKNHDKSNYHNNNKNYQDRNRNNNYNKYDKKNQSKNYNKDYNNMSYMKQEKKTSEEFQIDY